VKVFEKVWEENREAVIAFLNAGGAQPLDTGE